MQRIHGVELRWSYSLPTKKGRPDVRLSGLNPRLVLGTMMYGDSICTDDAFAQMDHAFEHGIVSFDSAEMYPVPQCAETQGASERCIGEWMVSRKIPRDAVELSTKVSGPGGMDWIRGGPERLDGENIVAAVENSLKRLNTEYVDTLLLHWPDRYVPMFGDSIYESQYAYDSFCSFEEQREVMDRLHREGKILSFGLSNETPYGVMKFCQTGVSDSMIRPAVIQNSYNLLCRTFETGGLAECCHMEGVGLMAYSPLAMGLLSGKYDCHGFCEDTEARLVKFKGRYAEAESRYGPKPNVYEAIEAYVKLAEKHGMTPVELAMRFACSHPQVVSVVVGASSISQLNTLILSHHEGPLEIGLLTEIDAIHARYPNPCP